MIDLRRASRKYTPGSLFSLSWDHVRLAQASGENVTEVSRGRFEIANITAPVIDVRLLLVRPRQGSRAGGPV